jgi:hypothetical protein
VRPLLLLNLELSTLNFELRFPLNPIIPALLPRVVFAKGTQLSLSPTIPALTGHSPVSPIIPALTRIPPGGRGYHPCRKLQVIL